MTKQTVKANGAYVVGYEGPKYGTKRLVGVLGPFASREDACAACLGMRRMQPERTFWTTEGRRMTAGEREAV